MKEYSMSLASTEDAVNAADSKAISHSFSDVYRSGGKRVFDLTVVLILAPFMVAVILMVSLAMVMTGNGGNLFFGHRRVGRDGRVFKCWKIRTMVVDAETKLRDYLAKHPEAAEEWERDHKLENDPRITPVGNFLRKTSLDELPQIWNVVRGEMSFVGPRPVVRSELHKYGAHRAAYTSVQPGVTGMWQVTGRNDVSYEERVQLDVDYVKNHNMLLDISLIVRTVTTMLNRTGK